MVRVRNGLVHNHYHQSTGNMDYTVVSTKNGVQLFAIQAFNVSSATLAYVKLYDSSVMSSVQSTAGTPAGVWMVPLLIDHTGSTFSQGAGFTVDFGAGLDFQNGIAYSLSTGVADNDTHGVPAAALIVNLQFED